MVDVGKEFIPDEFLSGYVGLVIKTGTVKIKTATKNSVSGKLVDILIGSSEITGLFIFLPKDFPRGYTIENLKNDLTSMGYKIHMDDSSPGKMPYEQVKVYFSYPLN